jgi:hypothetical protein
MRDTAYAYILVLLQRRLSVGSPVLSRSLWSMRSLSLVTLFLFSILTLDRADSQDVSFTPRHDAISTEKKRPKRKSTPIAEVNKAPQLYSLARYNLLFQEMCRLLDADMRRDRVYRVCKAAVEEEQGCSSCRALLRQIAQSCSSKTQPKKTTAQPRRYPRTDLVDVVSRLSEGLQEFGPGPGPVFDAVKSFESHLMGVGDLSPGERDYYGVLLTYFFSAWEGRPNSPLSAGTPSPSEIAELFQ